VKRSASFVGVMASCALLGACGAASEVSSTPVTSSASASANTTAAPRTTVAPSTTAEPQVAHVGATIAVSVQGTGINNVPADVTLVKVIDPAQGTNQFFTPRAGNRFVGAEFVIKAVRSASDDANSDAVLIGSNNQTYTPDFYSIAGCTNFNEGSFTLAPGQSTTGCVTFQVPSGVTVKQVEFGTQGGTVGLWEVP